MRRELGDKPTLGFIFATEDYQNHWADFSEILRVHGHLPILVGATSNGIIGTNREMEGQPGFSALFLRLPETKVKVIPVTNEMVEASGGARYWHQQTGLGATEVSTWVACMECVRFQVETWLSEWNAAYPGIPVIGGLVSGEHKVYYNEENVSGGVLLGLHGQGQIQAIVSQGCKPIGNPFTVTKVEQNVLYTLGSLPAYQVLNEAFEGLSREEKERARGNLFAGLALSEYIEDFKRGDFLVRHILGADPGTGAVALSALPRIGQTLQYQLRDAASASEELKLQLQSYLAADPPPAPSAALLFSCAGRGKGLFGHSNHDAGSIHQGFPNLPLAGFFGAGEIGPVGHRNYIHGYTAAIGMVG
jgi:small ligand-binding sensory domain FIST